MELSEEARTHLREIVERLAWRQTASINALGHSLKFVTELDVKRRIAGELDLHMRLFGRVRELYADLGWDDLQAVVRVDMDRVRYPQTRMEFGCAYYVTGLAEVQSMASYGECVCKPFADIAAAYVETAEERPSPTRFLAFAAEEGNRPRAQEILSTWYTVALETFTLREGADERVQELGLRAETTDELVEAYRERLAPFLSESGLQLP